MRKFMPFTLGILLGTIMATAWANYPANQKMGAMEAAAMNPSALMQNAGNLPVQGHVDAI